MTSTSSAAPWVNPVKARLARGEYVVGVPVTSTSLDMAALAARSGFDFLWVEMEHSPITLETLRHIVLATRGLPAVPFARIPAGETWMAKRVLDQGVHGVVAPFTRRRRSPNRCRVRAGTRRADVAVPGRDSPKGPGRRCRRTSTRPTIR